MFTQISKMKLTFPGRFGPGFIIVLLILSCTAIVFYHFNAFAGKGNGNNRNAEKVVKNIEGPSQQSYEEWLEQLLEE